MQDKTYSFIERSGDFCNFTSNILKIFNHKLASNKISIKLGIEEIGKGNG